jgi:hypothetical protein
MDGPERADPSDELELLVSDARAGAPASADPSAGSPFPPRRVLPRRVGTVVAVLALVIIVAVTPALRAPLLDLFLGTQATPTATLVSAYPTPVPGPHIPWQPTAPLPDQLTLGSGDVHLAVAPSDGRTAYLCDVTPAPLGAPTPSGATSQFWVTHDRGAHWTPALEISEQANATRCDAQIDALDPSRVVLTSSNEDLAAAAAGPVDSLPNQTVSEATFDGGATWRRLAGNQQILGPTTVNGVTFALRATQPGQDSSAPITTELAMSRDQLRTWTPIDAALRAASPQEQVWDYSLDPSTGALVVATSDTSGPPVRLWSSSDNGQRWRESQMPAGDMSGFMRLWLPWPARDAPKRICGAPASGASGVRSAIVVCSADGGATWTHPNAFPYNDQSAFGGFAPDGALLLTGSGTDAQGNPIGGTVLYRLPASVTRWQTLGPAPEPLVISASGPGAGVLWALPLGPSASDAHGQIYTADYP